MEHTLTTVDGEAITLVLQNTMLGDVRFRLFNRYASEQDWPDFNFRSDFAWLMAFVVEIRCDWLATLETNATEDEFSTAYYALMGKVDQDAFYGAVRAVNAMKQRTDKIEKPDTALTPEEEADPNS